MREGRVVKWDDMMCLSVERTQNVFTKPKKTIKSVISGGLRGGAGAFPRLIDGLKEWLPPEGLSIPPLMGLRFFGALIDQTEERSVISERVAGSAGGSSGRPGETGAPSISTAKLWMWRSIVKVEIVAAIAHGIVLVLRFNSRVPVYKLRILSVMKDWIPSALFGLPLRGRFDMRIGDAW